MSPADQFVSGVQGQIEAFIAGLTGTTAPDRSLEEVPSAEETERNALCADSKDAPKEGGLCDRLGLTQVEQTSRPVPSQDIHAFLETYKGDLELKIRNTFSLDYFDGAMTQASKDWSNLAAKATQNDQRLTDAGHESAEQDRAETDLLVEVRPLAASKSPSPTQEKPKTSVASNKEAKSETRPKTAELVQKKLKRRSPSPAIGDKLRPESPVADKPKATRQENPAKKATEQVPEKPKLVKKETIKKQAGQNESPKKEANQKEVTKKEAVKKEVATKAPVCKEAVKKEAVKKEAVKKETVKKETAKKETAKKEATSRSAVARKAPSPGLEKPKAPQRATSTKKIAVPKQAALDPVFPVTIPASPKDTWPEDEQKQESDGWVQFSSEVFVTTSPRRLVQDLSRRRLDNEEEKVSTPEPTRRRRTPVNDLVFPVRTFSADGKEKIAQRNVVSPRSFAC